MDDGVDDAILFFCRHVGEEGEPDEALALANDTAYGLGGAVFSTDPERATRIAQRLEGAGSAWRPAEWLLFHSALFIGISVPRTGTSMNMPTSSIARCADRCSTGCPTGPEVPLTSGCSRA